jgi:hypothetical protein
MPYQDPDPDDPNMLVGVVLPGDAESVTYMAETFADEFAMLGYDEDRLLVLFRHPFYAGAHQALQVLGEETIREIIRQSVSLWGRCRVSVRDGPGCAGRRSNDSQSAARANESEPFEV